MACFAAGASDGDVFVARPQQRRDLMGYRTQGSQGTWQHPGGSQVEG